MVHQFEDDPWMTPQDHEDLQGMVDYDLPRGCSIFAIIVCVIIVIAAIAFAVYSD